MENLPPVPSRMKLKTRIVFSFILLAGGLLGWLMRPYPVIDEAKVHPALRGLGSTTKCGIGSSYGDGGSRSFYVRRPDGSEVELCMSNSLDHSFSERGELYIGASYFLRPAATKITGYEHTKFVVAKLLAQNPNSADIREDIALMTKRLPDWISFMAQDGLAETYEALRIFE